MIYANIQENHLLAERTAGAEALGQNELASESEGGVAAVCQQVV